MTNNAFKQPSVQVKYNNMSVPGNICEFLSSLRIPPILTEMQVTLGECEAWNRVLGSLFITILTLPTPAFTGFGLVRRC